MEVIQIVSYACILLSLGFIIGRIVKYATTPLHLRWELYPVAHEKGRAGYGGSIFEELDWWTKPREVDYLAEFKEMLKEILFLKGVYKHNRSLWYFSFPFHFGLYLIIVWLALMLFSAILLAAGATNTTGSGGILRYMVAIAGHAGLALTAIGALGLLARRTANAAFRRYSSPVEYINLLFILTAVSMALVTHLSSDFWFGMPVLYLQSLLTFGSPPTLSTAMQVELVLGSLLLAYIPMTRMAHFVAKYFLYHDVRWSDEPNPKGSRIEKKIKESFGYRMGWRASHIQRGKSWEEVGTQAQNTEGEKP